MIKSSIIVLAASVLSAALCFSAAAQEKANNSTRTDLAIEIVDGRHGRMPVPEGSYRQISLPDRLVDSKQSRETPAITGIRVRPLLEGDGLRVKIGVVFDDSQPVEAPGPKYGEKEEIIASYLAHLGDIVKVTELERFGIKALEFKVVLYQEPAVTDNSAPLVSFPKVVNELKSVGVVDWKPEDRHPGECRLILKNLSALKMVSLTLSVTSGYTQTMEGTRTKPLAKPGSTFETTLDFRHETVDARTTVVVKAVLFDDGSFDGDVDTGVAMAARLKGREVQLSRFLELLRKTSPQPDERATTLLQSLKSAVENFRIDVDPQYFEELGTGFSLPEGKRKVVAEKIMEGLKSARSQAQSLIREMERKLSENPATFDLSPALNALRERVANLVGTP